MAAVTGLLILACAIAIKAQPLSEVCGTVQTGVIIGQGIKLAKTPLAPGTADWEVVIPPVSQCPNGPAGVYAIVCDYDVLPTAQFISKSLLAVHRVGQLLGAGSVTPTVYCGNNHQPWQNNVVIPSQNVWGQSSIPSLTPSSLWDQSSQLPWNVWGQNSQSLIAQPSQPVWGQSPQPWDQSPQSWGQSTQLWDQSPQSWDQSPQFWAQSPQSWAQSPQSWGQSTWGK